MSKELIIDFWNTIDNQEWNYLSSFFLEDAKITWHNTYIDHQPFVMDVATFLKIQESSDALWSSVVERIEIMKDGIISITKNEGNHRSYYIVSIFELHLGKISRLDQYYGVIKERSKYNENG